jgi:hypothetical protein
LALPLLLFHFQLMEKTDLDLPRLNSFIALFSLKIATIAVALLSINPSYRYYLDPAYASLSVCPSIKTAISDFPQCFT